MTREEKASRLLHAMSDIDDRFIEEAAPKTIPYITASEDDVKTTSTAPSEHVDAVKTRMEARNETENHGKPKSPEDDHRTEPTVIYMKPQRGWKPMGIIAAAAVLVIGFGAYMKTEKASNAMAPVAFVTGAGSDMARAVDGEDESSDAVADQGTVGHAKEKSLRMETSADSGVAAAENDQEMVAEAAPYSDELSGNVDSRARTKSAMTETDAAPEEASSDASMGMQILNPWRDFDSLEEAEADAGIQIELPDIYQNFNDHIYRSMHGEMLEIIYQDAEGQEGFRIRKSRGSEDISGDYTSYAQKKTLAIHGRSVETRGNNDEISTAIWNSTDDSYAICIAEDQHFTEEDIRNLVEAIDPSIWK